jgi:hypothetical protein
MVLNWGDVEAADRLRLRTEALPATPTRPTGRGIDWIVGCEILYDEVNHDFIIATLRRLVGVHTRLIMAYQHREGWETNFFDKVRDFLRWRPVVLSGALGIDRKMKHTKVCAHVRA